jgi:hypothetical protein
MFEEAPLYELLLVRKGEEPVRLTSADANTFTVEQLAMENGEGLTLTYGGHGAHDVSVFCRVMVEADAPLTKWWISIKNNTPYGIRAIRYPILLAPLILGDSPKDDCFVDPGGLALGGEITRQPTTGTSYTYTGEVAPLDRRLQYPGPASLQVQAYYDDAAGLYMATYDAGGNVKHFGVKKLRDALDVSIEHNYDEQPGLSFELPYGTVLGVFHGDWYCAADLYKGWASKQHWCAKKTSERADIPDWLKEPRPTLQYECRGDMQRCRGAIVNYPPSDYPFGKFWPAMKVIPLTEKYSSLFDSPVVVWYNGWEKHGNPSGPVDSLPPHEGAESLRGAMAELTRQGCIPYMAVWGNHWIYKRRGAGYDGAARFEREGASLCCVNERGEMPTSGTAEFTYATLCNGSERAQQLLADYASQIMDLGSIALEIDHQAWPSECHSDQHDHPPGFGPWMGQKTTEFLRKMRAVTKRKHAAGAMSFEGTSEIWIQEMDFMLDRPYIPGNLPLFAYIYHEYIPMLGGDGPYGITHPEEQLIQHATNFAYGHMSFIMVGINDYDFGVNPDFPIFTLLRNTCHAGRTYAREYIVFGEMHRPTRLKTASIWAAPWRTWNQPDPPLTIEVPKVMHSVWKGKNGKLGYVLVNWTGADEEVTVELLGKEGSVAIVTRDGRKPLPPGTAAAGEVSAAVPARCVLLIEQEGVA